MQPEFREYERLSTTVLNAYLQPVMARYMARLEAALAERLPQAEVGINQSSGGLMSLARAAPSADPHRALRARGGRRRRHRDRRAAGRADVITLDMGGTSADVCLIRDGQAAIAYDRQVAGFPIRLPMVDINTVGAGGGSIAWFDRDGLMKVGPQSAGADPGPACYGPGGTEPTVTDANLLLGRLSPRGLLGGRMPLDRAAARAALDPLAAGSASTSSAPRTACSTSSSPTWCGRSAPSRSSAATIPARFALMPFGGAGPLHARDVARALGMRAIVVPPAPGILCAQGLVVSDLKEDFVPASRLPVDGSTDSAIRRQVPSCAPRRAAWFAHEEVAHGRER